ncbi:MAG: aminotransferase class III-fold pyridoxal phosphate-dependent enzyme [Deltaproteobacteria bacterium]|nr:aminotransferase class III-fold pyridoxal phosphate-dependent enzyme [Deltaproteobacteria bacterium]
MADSLEDIDRRTHLHPFTSIAEHAAGGPLVMREGRGIRLKDVRGREYLDAMAGLWCVNVGYGREELVAAIAAQARQLAYYHSFFSMTTEPAVRLADRLLRLSPWPMSRVFFGLSGSDANDTQFKLVWLYQGLRGKPAKRKIIARHRGYHGVTVASASASGLPLVHARMGLPIPGFVHVRAPHAYRECEPGIDEAQFASQLAAELDETIRREGPDTVGAFIAEPVMGAGGVLVPPKAYFPAVQEVLRRHDVLFIADEVICGFGRLGRTFGGEVFGIEPDLVTLAKGLTSGYVPLSACLISPRVWAEIEEQAPDIGVFGHGFTYSAHPLAAAAALANLDVLERDRLFERARRIGAHLQERLRGELADKPWVGEVRGLGMIAAVELVADPSTRRPFDPALRVGVRVFRRMLADGIIVRALGDSIALCPPYVIEVSEVDEIVGALARAIDGIGAEIRAAQVSAAG